MHATATHHGPFANPKHNVERFDIEPGSIVADFGAGSGAYTLAIAETLDGTGRVYAIDVQQDLLRRIKNEAHRRGIQNIDTIWGDVSRPHGTKIANASVDMVLMSNILFQLEQPQEAFAEARRILKLTGRLTVIDWLDSFGGLGPTKKHVFPKDRAIETAKTAGFKIVGEFPAGAHHYGVHFQKAAPPSTHTSR